LGLGVIISMFTAIIVTRTFLRLIIDLDVVKHHRWFGV
jgi:preprotein translocase subunit SecD